MTAAYIHGIVQNHAFIDGNKRTGYLAGYAFLELNGIDFAPGKADYENLIWAISGGERSREQVAMFIRAHIGEIAVETDPG